MLYKFSSLAKYIQVLNWQTLFILYWYFERLWNEHTYLSCTGGNGYINDYPTGRFLRDAKLYEIGAGTSEVRRLIIGRAINANYK